MTETEPQVEFPWLANMKPTELIARFVELRDARKKTEEAHDAYIRKNYLNEMELIEKKLIDVLNQTGAKSIASDDGTAYKYLASSVTVSDQRLFRRHVIGAEAWDLIEWRASKSAVLEQVEDGKETPPGVNLNTAVKIGIRRPEK